MATKGDKSKLYDAAMKMYVDGHSLTGIADALGVSRQTLTQWKADTKVPDQDVDQWDRARAQKSSGIQRLRDLFDRQLEFVESCAPADVTAPMMDTLSKLGALVERWDRVEKEIRKKAVEDAAKAMGETAKQAGISEETIGVIRRDVLKMAE
jgi:transposase